MLLDERPTDITAGRAEHNEHVPQGNGLEHIPELNQEVGGVDGVADYGVGATPYEASIRGCEAKGTTKHEEGQDGDRKAKQLKAKSRIDSPFRVETAWPEQHSSERPPEGKEPVTKTPADNARGPPDKEPDHEAHLLHEERETNQPVRLKVKLEGGVREERRAACSGQIHKDPDQAVHAAERRLGIGHSLTRGSTQHRSRRRRRWKPLSFCQRQFRPTQLSSPREVAVRAGHAEFSPPARLQRWRHSNVA